MWIRSSGAKNIGNMRTCTWQELDGEGEVGRYERVLMGNFNTPPRSGRLNEPDCHCARCPSSSEVMRISFFREVSCKCRQCCRLKLSIGARWTHPLRIHG